MPSPSTRKEIIFLLIYLVYLGAFTLAPFDFSTVPPAGKTWLQETRAISDLLLNAIGFIPLGAILYSLTGAADRPMWRRWAWTLSSAAFLSLSIEISQLFLPTRVSSPGDLLANTLGGGLGFLMAHGLHHRPSVARLTHHQRAFILSGLLFYLGGLISLFTWTALPQQLDGWEPGYPLLIGNEATLDRPWLGKVFFVALYDRALPPQEIESQFRAGPHSELKVHVPSAPIALYLFQERTGGQVQDHAPVAPPLDLKISTLGEAIWLPRGGLEFTEPTILRSTERPEKIYERLTATDRFSVATWIEPRDTLQSGPARIVSYSLNPSLRNFTLGQEGVELHFRVRNPAAGPNGTRWDLRTKGLGLKAEPTHVVAIYDRGTERLYVNGVLIERVVTGRGLTFLARALAFDAGSPWQKAILVVLLIGPVAGCWGALGRKCRVPGPSR